MICFNFLLALVSLPSVSYALLPNGECTVLDMTCQLENDNVVGIVNGVTSDKECIEQCQENSTDCAVYSYYGPDGYPFVDTCVLYRNCPILEPATDCFTAESPCSKFCHAPIEGVLGTNLIDFVASVSEAACEAECEVVESCHFFTYHWANSSTNPGTCFLLKELQEPFRACDDGTCISGSSNCEYSLCGFLEDGIMYQNGIVANETKEVDMLMLGPCASSRTLAVVVGGGGDACCGSTGGGASAGGGSGYVEFTELSVSEPLMHFEAIVGLATESSKVKDLSSGNTVLEALSGGPGGEANGGAGYSGGGADGLDTGNPNENRGGNGGSNGSNGYDSCCNVGGQGSSLDLGVIPVRNFDLSPGNGGVAGNGVNGNCDGGYCGGGGGGGVFIDGTGPGLNSNRGQGYGAGGGTNIEVEYAAGFPGVIIFDFIQPTLTETIP